MFRSKKEVDKHVSDILNRIKNENERNLRGYIIAKLYYMVGDYETAKRYLAGFLSVKERDPNAHKLMGQIHERTCQLEKAVQSYKKSLELLDNQKDVVLKICELYCQLPVDSERARYWADRAEKLFPNHEIVFKLRECIVNADGEQNTHELEQLIATELMNRPRDANLRIKLLKLYLDTERSKDAYHHAIDVERKHPYHDNINWYYCIIDVLEAYLEDNGKEYKTELLKQLLHSYDRLVFLSLEENHQSCRISNRILHPTNLMNSASALHSFDQTLHKAEQHEENDESWKCFINHMKGQLYFHFGTFLLKRAKKDHGQGNVKEASRMSAALFLLAYTFKPFDRHCSWYCQASEDKRKEFDYVYNQSCFRLSQTGHVVIGMCKEDRSKWLQKIRQQVCTVQCKDKIFQRVFSTQESRQTSNTSYFANSQTFLEFSPEFPDINTVQEYDEVTYSMYPDSLHHIVWLALQYYSLKQKVQPDYKISVFNGLQYSVNNINTATAESLCLLDVEAFLYATVQTVALALEERHSSSYSSSDFPLFLPVSISPALCTADQADWWSTAHKLFKNTAKENLGKLRGILQHGIEVIRVIGNHGMHVSLVVHLAETFAERAMKLKNQTEENEMWQLVEKRAAHYWKAAINMLEKLANNQSIRLPKQCLFETNSQDPSMKELKKLLEAGRFFLACQSMNAKKYEEALEVFESLKSPYASYYQATIFKKLAAEEYNQPKEQITSEMRSKHIILLTRARDALYATLDRIHGDRKHPLNQVLSEEIEDIETKLRRIDPDVSQRHDFDCLSDECLSSQDSEDRDHSPDSVPHTFMNRQSFRKSSGFSHSRNLLHSTPHISVPYFSSGRDSAELQASCHREEHTRPSPERLDAQMRSLAFSHDAVIKTIVEQNKPLLETHHSIVEVLQQIKNAIEQIKMQLVEIQKQINNQAPRRRPQHRKFPVSNKQVASQQKLWNGNKADEQESNEDYYDGYYYDEQTEYDDTEEAENNYQEFQFHPAFKYPEPLHNEYPYGQITGLHGTSTVTYAPPAGSRSLMGHPAVCSVPPAAAPAYPAYYPPPQVINPHSHQTPPLRPPLPTHALGPGYFGPAGPTLSTGLTFSEGQKLPEFHFNPTIPPPNANFTTVYTEHKAPVFSRLGPPAPPNENSLSNEAKFAAIPGDFAVPPVIIVPNQPNVPQLSTLQVPRYPDKTSNDLPVHRLSSEEDHYREDEDYSGPDFKPVIPLPDEVEVKTGEEDEKILFEDKAKLFRFVDKEWKERGIGFVKLLWHEKTGKVRVLMRRDQIFKICANHYIQTDMKLAPMKNNDSAWVWAAQDFADEEVKTEQFCIKFKTSEIANKFKREFEKAKQLIANAEKSLTSKSSHPIENVQLKNQTSSADQSEGFLNKHLPPPGSWKCSTCWIFNTADSLHCTACQAAKPKSSLPGKLDEPIKTSPSKPSADKSEKGFGSEFLPKPGSWNCPTCYLNNSQTAKICVACESPNPNLPAAALVSRTESASSIPKFSFGLPQTTSSNFTFGFSSTLNNSTDNKPSTNGFKIEKNETSDHSNNNFGGFSFALPKTTTEQVNVTVDTSKKNLLDTPNSFPPTTTSSDGPASGFIFGSPSSNAAPKSTSGFIFGNSSSNMTPKSTTGFVFGMSTMQNDGKSMSDKNMGSASSLLNAMAAKHQTEENTLQTTPSSTFNYGGFTFTTLPTIKSPNDSETSKTLKPISSKSKEKISESPRIDSAIKTSPFAGFSFTLNKTESSTPVNSVPSEKSEHSSESSSGLTAILENKNPNITTLSFSDLASTASKTDAFKSDPNFQGFSGSGEAVFKRIEKTDTSPVNDEYEPSVDFKPVIPLPDLVEIKTGEEDEEKIFGERAKLYRFDIQLNQWKERGVGEIKLLRHKTTGKCRVLMRREQVLKLCANHYIQPDMNLKELFTTSNGWTWSANDFSEGELKLEMLAVKFKTTEQANAFKNAFIKCIEESGEISAKMEPDLTDPNKAATKLQENVPLSALFKPEADTWECSECYVRNKSDINVCIACSSPRPNSVKTNEGKSSSDSSKINKLESGVWECKTCHFKNADDSTVCIGCEAPKTDSSFGKKPEFPFSIPSGFKFQFGTDSGSTGFNFNSSAPISSGFVFGTSSTESNSNAFELKNCDNQSSKDEKPASEKDNEEASVSVTEFRFGSPQKFTFSFSGIRPKSPVKTPKSPHSEVKDKSVSGDEDDSLNESEGDHIYFQPVIPLPDKIDVKTGEEDEETLYCQRAKLFRLIDSEWKERGIGDFKILQHQETKKIRLLMRRDQILKVCLNHSLTPEIKFVAKDDKSWLWVTTDFADNEARQERFAIRFKNAEISKQFIQAINDAKESLKNLAKGTTDSTKITETKDEVHKNSFSSVPTATTSTPSKTSPSSTSTFSFKMDNVSTPPSPSVNFSFGNKFGSTTPPGRFSLFGGGTKATSLPQPNLFVFGAGNVPETSEDDDDVTITCVKEATREQKEKAMALQLPPNFYLYEDAPPCPGCRGCTDNLGQDNNSSSSTESSADVEIITEEVADAEKIALALKLQLPRNFYLYENKPPCPGCRGCSDEIPQTGGEKNNGETTETPQNSAAANTGITSQLFQTAGGIDFASLAKEETSFLTQTPTAGFAFNNTGNKVFASEDDDANGSDTVANKDPYFEPIVPLPELVEVKTGEEDEEKVYGQRAKLYRFDPAKKEWKERGIGEMKILKHKETGRIRLLLRREQVHKIACNHYITKDMNLTPLSTSDTAWCWHAMDFAEEMPKLEQFAIKFKTVKAAQEFKDKFEEYQLEVSGKETEKQSDMAFGDDCEAKDQVTPKADARKTDSEVTILNVENAEIAKDDVPLSNETPQHLTSAQKCTNSNEDDNDDDDDDDDDEESVMFEKRITLAYFIDNKYEPIGIGNLRVLYDDDVYGARIQMITDAGNLICNHIITMQTTLKVEDKMCHWTCLDYSSDNPIHRQFRATFSSPAAADEFKVIFAEGKEYAKHSEIWEKPDPSYSDDLSENGGGIH